MTVRPSTRRKAFDLALFLDPEIDRRPIQLTLSDLRSMCLTARSIGWRNALPRLGLRTIVGRLRAMRLGALTVEDVSEGLLPTLDTPGMPQRLRDTIVDVAVRSGVVSYRDLLQSPHAEVRMAAILASVTDQFRRRDDQ